jgi:hypothetical protein
MTLAKRDELDENVTVRACDWCGQLFYKGRDNHRFCCVEHGREFHIAERRAAVALYRQQREKKNDHIG